uniref:Mediator of RNA polymerase II transcription subunit 21 n=1 Tax=Amphimedon queenslandica TaxID=400682 RepID=A0A1X7UHQ9_AMPQE
MKLSSNFNPIWSDKMADRLTQLQDAVTQMSDYFCNSIGILQQNQTTETKEGGGESSTNNATLFASLISQTATDIETLIESLPDQEYTPEKQEETLKNLVAENQVSGEKLRQVINEAAAAMKFNPK